METRNDKQGVAFNDEEERVWEPTQESAAHVLEHDRELSWTAADALGQGVNRVAETPT